jgi:hypothetical protein
VGADFVDQWNFVGLSATTATPPPSFDDTHVVAKILQWPPKGHWSAIVIARRRKPMASAQLMSLPDLMAIPSRYKPPGPPSLTDDDSDPDYRVCI